MPLLAVVFYIGLDLCTSRDLRSAPLVLWTNSSLREGIPQLIPQLPIEVKVGPDIIRQHGDSLHDRVQVERIIKPIPDKGHDDWSRGFSPELSRREPGPFPPTQNPQALLHHV